MKERHSLGEELEKLAGLRASGALTEEEYIAAKGIATRKERSSHFRVLAGWTLFVVLGITLAFGLAAGPYFYFKAQDTKKILDIPNEFSPEASTQAISEESTKLMEIDGISSDLIRTFTEAGANANAAQGQEHHLINNPTIVASAVKIVSQARHDSDFKNIMMNMVAAATDNPEVITALIKAGADINKRQKNDTTPLMTALAMNSNSRIATTLIEAGADVNARESNQGMTLLLHALDLKLLKRFLKLGLISTQQAILASQP